MLSCVCFDIRELDLGFSALPGPLFTCRGALIILCHDPARSMQINSKIRPTTKPISWTPHVFKTWSLKCTSNSQYTCRCICIFSYLHAFTGVMYMCVLWKQLFRMVCVCVCVCDSTHQWHFSVSPMVRAWPPAESYQVRTQVSHSFLTKWVCNRSD